MSATLSLLLIVCFLTINSQVSGHCRVSSGSSNYCSDYDCYFYSNTEGQVGETLKYCASLYGYNNWYVYIYFTGELNIELNLPSNVRSLYFENEYESNAYINSTKVHSSLTSLKFYYKSYHFNQAFFFSYFPNLQYLYANAFLDFKYPQTFTRLSQLSYLYVNPPSGSLTWKFELTNDAFRGLTNLKTLELIGADITDIRYAFHGLTRLTHLGLEGNKIDKLEPNIFKDLKSLTYLDLDGNGIDEVSEDAFNGLTALKSLSISGNQLFPLNTLYKLNALTSLQINYNSYRTLSPDPFEQLASLRYIYADNPFFCDCSLRWTSVVSQYSLSIQSAYCLEPGKVYRTAITSQTLYTNCTADRSYNCFSKSISCPTELVCRNTASSYACTCADGFSLSHTGQCYDENECQLGIDNCEHQCNNTIGSYECYCNTGYQLSADDRTCEDVDECDESTDKCDTHCQNFQGGYQCYCDAGYRLVNQISCMDIDECLINNGGCQGTCINIGGSYLCNQTSVTVERVKIVKNDVNNVLLALVILLIVLIILMLLIFVVFLLISWKRKSSYEGILQHHQNEGERIYDDPAEYVNGNASLIEKGNTDYDSISENSLQLYPAPIAEVLPVN